MAVTLKNFLPESLISLSEKAPAPIYAVGGIVRDFLSGFEIKNGADTDICAPIKSEAFISLAKENGFGVTAVYKATGTVKLRDGEGNAFEFSPFRTDKYVRGLHTPKETFFTTDIFSDAARRDFTCNAVYYDIKNDSYTDPLGGIAAIREKRISCVKDAGEVFGEDGLRLMRLARFVAQTGFKADSAAILGARENAALIRDIHAERIWSELSAILTADEKHSLPYAQYFGLKALDDTRVLDNILPELTRGRNMEQRSDFHAHDVLEHSLRCVKYCKQGLTLRYAALLHDVGKPDCFLRTGNFHSHDAVGAAMLEEISARLKVPKFIFKRAQRLIALHMYDLSMNTGENKLKRFFVENYDVLSDLMEIKQADYSACRDDLNKCPSNIRWEKILSDMRSLGAPMSLKELKINGNDISSLGYEKNYTAKILHALLLKCAADPSLNEKNSLIRLSDGVYRDIKNNERISGKNTTL